MPPSAPGPAAHLYGAQDKKRYKKIACGLRLILGSFGHPHIKTVDGVKMIIPGGRKKKWLGLDRRRNPNRFGQWK
jgi:hypothetical protein